jgi:hypothetical protein
MRPIPVLHNTKGVLVAGSGWDSIRILYNGGDQAIGLGSARDLNERTLPTDEQGQPPVPAFQIAGSARDSAGAEIACLWEFDDAARHWIKQDVNALIPKHSPYKIVALSGINNSGMAVGTAIHLATGKSRAVALLPLEIAVDANRDGNIMFASDNPFNEEEDSTTQDKPYRFWVNSDMDTQAQADAKEGNGDESVNGADPANEDWDATRNSVIDSTRDLEDFQRLHLSIGGLRDGISNGTIKIGFKWKSVTQTPAVKIYRAADPEGALDYLSDMEAAQAQLADNYKTAIATVQGTEIALVPANVFEDLSDTNVKVPLLFEGAGVGKGQLVAVILKSDGATVLGEGLGVWLNLKKVTDMYQESRATPWVITDPQTHYEEQPPAVETEAGALSPGSFDAPPDEQHKVVLWVHGWNVSEKRYQQQTQAMFKRLWWQGFKGRFVALRWNSVVQDVDQWSELEGIYDALKLFFQTAPNALAYNQIEYKAFKYGAALNDCINNRLPTGYSVHLAAHSMGAILTSQAVHAGNGASACVIMNAAAGAQMFDNNLADEAGFPVGRPYNVPELGYKGYFASNGLAAVNFFNPLDNAVLVAWRINNNLELMPVIQSKPWVGVDQQYYWDVTEARTKFKKKPTQQPNWFYRNVTDAHESMALASQSRTEAAGTRGDVQGAVQLNVSMAAGDMFGQNSQHSPQFDFNIQNGVMEFYNQLARRLSVKP